MLTIKEPSKPQKSMPVFQSSFRIFFIFGSVFSLFAILIWMLILRGSYTTAPFNHVLWWHSHEMLFGFTSAIITGFLLTAVKTWTGINSTSRGQLLFLFLLWLSARILFFVNPQVNPFISIFVDLSFLPLTALLLSLPLIKAKMYRNIIFVPVLLLMSLSNLLSHLALLGYSQELLNQGLYSMIMLVILLVALLGGRVIPMFTANGLGTVKILPKKWLEVSALASVFFLYLGMLFGLTHLTGFFALVSFIAAALHFYRLLRWKPWTTFSNSLVWSLHLSMAFIPLGLLLMGVSFLSDSINLSMAIHSLTVGAIGGMILAMMARVSLGHTGRPLNTNRFMSFAFAAIIFAALSRSFFIIVLPSFSYFLITLSGFLWCISFAIFLWLYTTVLITPRADGRSG